MAIPRYFSLITNVFHHHGRILKPRLDTYRFHHIYFDLNNFLYPLAQSSRTESVFLIRLQNEIEKYLRNIKNLDTVKSIYLAIDGPSPRAKYDVQRLRRLRRVSSEHVPKLIRVWKAENSIQRGKIDILQFTPGTMMMQTIKQQLQRFVMNLVRKDLYKNVCVGECH